VAAGAGDPLIPLFDVRLSDAEVAAVEETLRSGWLTMGPRTEEFERAFAEQLGAPHALAVSSGTAALHLSYLAAGVGPGHEVVVPAFTFVASAAAARYCGASVVFADVRGQHDLGIDPAEVEALITPRTRAVCAVHFAGYAADVHALRELCDAHGLALIEDAAHSPSATAADGERKLGTYGLAGAFSFFSNKVLGCGEGGLVATADGAVADRVRSLRSHAMTSGTWDRHRGHSNAYDVTELGFNYRLDEPRAALLLSRLPGLEDDIARRRALVRRYRELLRAVEGVSLPYRDEDVERSSCYVMPVMVDDPAARDPLRALMLERWRVQTSVLYPAIHELSAYAECARGALPHTELAARTELTLPLHPGLSEGDQDRVVEALAGGLEELRARPAAGAAR
jgi:dTDP-4-amino-4,6-dideoxygalactose transaminase